MHKSDWKPGHVTDDYRSGYDQIDWKEDNDARDNPEGRSEASKDSD